jgi:hypothetical protein
MTTFQLLSLLASIAALFGWISSRWLRLPITIGTMLLTVACSLCLMGTSGILLLESFVDQVVCDANRIGDDRQ